MGEFYLGMRSSNIKNIMWGGLYFILYVLIYGLYLPRLGLTQDEVVDFDGSAVGIYIGNGRWGLALYRTLVGGGAAPWAGSIMAGLYLCTAIVLQTRLLRLNTPGLKFCYGSLMLGMTQFKSMLIFSVQSDAIAFGFVLCTLTCLLLFRKGTLLLSHWLMAILMLCLAIGFYQSLIFYCAALAVGSWLIRRQEGEPDFFLRFAYRFGLTFLFALLLYFSLRSLTLVLPLASKEQIEGSLQYQQGLTQGFTFLVIPFTQKLLYLAHYFKYVFYSGLGLMYAGQWVYATTLIPLMFIFFRYLRQKEAWITRLLRLLALAFLWLSPHIMIVLLGSTIGGERVNLPEPLCCALLWVLWLRGALLSPFLKRLGCILLLFILVHACYAVSSKAWMESLNHERKVNEMRLLCAAARHFAAKRGVRSPGLRIQTVYKPEGDPPPTVSCSNGCVPLELLKSRLSERRELAQEWSKPFCFETTDYYDRLYHFTPGGRYLAPLPASKREQWEEEISHLSSWPVPGCMMLKDDCVIVRVSEE